jgi:hypothetical protein
VIPISPTLVRPGNRSILRPGASLFPERLITAAFAAAVLFSVPPASAAQPEPETIRRRWFSRFAFYGVLEKGEFWETHYRSFFTPSLPDWKHEPLGTERRRIYFRNPESLRLFGVVPVRIEIEFGRDRKPEQMRIILWGCGEGGETGSESFESLAGSIRRFLQSCREAGLSVQRTDRSFSSRIRPECLEIDIGKTRWQVQVEPEAYIALSFHPRDESGEGGLLRQKFREFRAPDIYRKKETFRETLKKNVRSNEQGDVFLYGIPMIDQGEKAYCGPATCARILKYYGFDTDEHQMAEIMKTSASEGTTIHSFRRSLDEIDSGLPFHSKEIRRSFKTVAKYIRRGVPVLWGIRYPDHVSLILGFNEREESLIFSDSWGERGTPRKISYRRAESRTEFFMVLK